MGNPPSRAQYRMVTAKNRQKKLRLRRSRHSAKSDSPYANAIREYLMTRGVDADRLVVIPYGTDRPICQEAWTRAGHKIAGRLFG